MRSHFIDLTWTVALLLSSLACSSATTIGERELADANDVGRSLPATSVAEQRLLLRLPDMRSGQRESVGELMVIPEPIYDAASGRRCRGILEQPSGERRLACTNGGRWFFVPDVFGTKTEP